MMNSLRDVEVDCTLDEEEWENAGLGVSAKRKTRGKTFTFETEMNNKETEALIKEIKTEKLLQEKKCRISVTVLGKSCDTCKDENTDKIPTKCFGTNLNTSLVSACYVEDVVTPVESVLPPQKMMEPLREHDGGNSIQIDCVEDFSLSVGETLPPENATGCQSKRYVGVQINCVDDIITSVEPVLSPQMMTMSSYKDNTDVSLIQSATEYEEVFQTPVFIVTSGYSQTIKEPVYSIDINAKSGKTTSDGTESDHGNNHTEKPQNADREIAIRSKTNSFSGSEREISSETEMPYSPHKTLESNNKTSNNKTQVSRDEDTRDEVNSKGDQIKTLLYEAAFHQNIVLQASQALNIAEFFSADGRSSPAVIEGERLLLLATERRSLCLEEVKLLKENVINEYSLQEKNVPPPCTATLTLSDIKLPLHHEFMNSLQTGKSDLGFFHLVLIASAGYKNIHSTNVVSCHIDMEDCAVAMTNIIMKNVPHDFTLCIRVFGISTGKNNNNIRKLKEKVIDRNFKNFFSKKSREEWQSDASPRTVFRKSNFKLLGENELTLSSLGEGLTKYELIDVPSTCPIKGEVQLRVSCSPEYTANAGGVLTFKEDVSGYPEWNSRWCNMKGNEILYWRQPEDERVKEAIGRIDLRNTSDEFVKLLPAYMCARPHTFELKLTHERLPSHRESLMTKLRGKMIETKCWICCDNEENRVVWMGAINKQLSDSVAWR